MKRDSRSWVAAQVNLDPDMAPPPIALKPQAAGQEIDGPMAFTILDKPISSNFLLLILLPSLALRFGRFRQPSA